jgi:hypothetical protein
MQAPARCDSLGAAIRVACANFAAGVVVSSINGSDGLLMAQEGMIA